MHEAIRTMLDRYACQTRDEYANALREILQELALLGLWRGKFFEQAAFYGGTALRVLYGLDRYSENLDFSLLASDPKFSLGPYGEALLREIGSFGFRVEFQQREKSRQTAIDLAEAAGYKVERADLERKLHRRSQRDVAVVVAHRAVRPLPLNTVSWKPGVGADDHVADHGVPDELGQHLSVRRVGGRQLEPHHAVHREGVLPEHPLVQHRAVESRGRGGARARARQRPKLAPS